jgi:hypothetical protein
MAYFFSFLSKEPGTVSIPITAKSVKVVREKFLGRIDGARQLQNISKLLADGVVRKYKWKK